MPKLDPAIPELWFERLGAWLGVPLWAAAVVIGTGPFLLLGVLVLQASAPANATIFDVVGYVVSSSALALTISLLTFYTGRYLRREITGLREYARSLEDSQTEGTQHLDLSYLTSTKGMLISYVLLSAVTVPLFVIGGTGSLVENVIGEIPYLWSSWILATFFWTFGYSMYAIYKMGKLPLKLKPYTQDKTLGLKPFATASLNSSLIYFALVTALVLVILTGGAIPVSLGLLFLGLYPLGLLLFLLPLRSLHAKLVEAKAQKLAWLEPRATAMLRKLESEQGVEIDQVMTNELLVMDKIQRDIQQIRAWPFDTGILTRLAAIIISVVAIILARILQLALNLAK